MNNTWLTLSAEDGEWLYPTSKPEPIPFDADKYAPLSYKPDDRVVFAVNRARQLLSMRTSEQCIIIAQVIARMNFIVEVLGSEAETYLPVTANKEWTFKGRALFQWMNAFDLSDLGLNKVEWHEIFALQVLMLCAIYSKYNSVNLQSPAKNLTDCPSKQKACYQPDMLILSIVDSLARCETLEKHGRSHSSAKILGSKGGVGRTKKMAPLETEVVRLFLKDFIHMPVLKAANCINVILHTENPSLLLLTKNKDKTIAIQNIIHKIKKGKIKMIL